MKFEAYPFEKLNTLLEDIIPNDSYELSVLTIGEPKFETPTFIQNELKNSISLLKKYPPLSALPELQNSIINFFEKRFQVTLNDNQIIPTFGTKEALFNFPQFLLFDKKNPVMAYPNPCYQIYEGAAIASKAQIIYMNLTKENSYQSSLSSQEMEKCDFVILNYPNNPTSSSISSKALETWVLNALKYDFVLLNDECYSEIYFDDDNKPMSLLEASRNVNNHEFKNILIVNSLSKRSSAPGLRSGFIAGDSTILKDYAVYRTYLGCLAPIPLQKAACAAWSDEIHVQEFRENYYNNFKIAKEILGVEIPKATFYLWIKVKDDIELTKKLYKEKNVKVLPGSFLGRNDIGKNFIRIALVENEAKTREVLLRIKDLLGQM